MQDVVISATDLTLGYGNVPVVTHINLALYDSEFIAILGPNGSGKSTFLRTLLGLNKSLHGELHVFGKKPFHGNADIGYIPQMRQNIFLTNLSGRAILNATLQGTTLGFPYTSSAKITEIERVLYLVDGLTLADKPLKILSGGERQRIYLAQALLNSPKILLLDEPLSNLDPHFQEIFINILDQIKKTLGVTILLTAHDPNPLIRVMNRVLFFARNKFLIGTIDEIINSKTLSELYDTSIDVIEHHGRLFVLGDGENILGQVIHHD